MEEKELVNGRESHAEGKENQRAGVKIVCLGDSLTWGFPFGPQFSWVSQVSQRYGLEMINRGINGDTTDGMLERFSDHVVRHCPTHVVIMGGTNDVIIRESLDRICYNWRQLVETSCRQGIVPVVGLPIPLGWKEPEKRLARLRRWLVDFAAERRIKVINFAAPFFDPETGEVREELLLDGGHPTVEGYAAMARQVDPAELGWIK